VLQAQLEQFAKPGGTQLHLGDNLAEALRIRPDRDMNMTSDSRAAAEV
jgi:hypothetical protein